MILTVDLYMIIPMTKCIVLCADDFGQAKAISLGIINLIQSRRISATSCMVNMPFWEEHAKWLQPYQDKIDIGLHVNLTEGRAVSKTWIETYGEQFFSLSAMLRQTIFRQLNKAIVEEECAAQIVRFKETIGFLPDFIDGHQHIHQFPVIREALIGVYKKYLSQSKAYIRWVGLQLRLSDWIRNPKKVIIYLTGTNASHHGLIRHQIPHNTSFSGIYSFSHPLAYRTRFLSFLREISHKGLILCHPALALDNMKNDEKDHLAVLRALEYKYLMSAQFLEDLDREEVKLERFQ